MKTKQIVGIIVAGLMFVFVCATSMLMNKFFGDFSTDLFKDDVLESTTPDDDYVGIVRVEGTMQMEETSSGLFESEGYDHQSIIDTVDDYMSDKNNKGILLYVNSPGGTVTAADDLYLKLEEYKKETKRPIYVYMDEQACSGGYYVSVAGDTGKVFANRNAWTGSIGVYMELANYKVLFDKLGIKTTYIKAGKNKTMGSPTQDLTDEQTSILQSMVDESYEQFVSVIVAGRKNMTEKEIRTAADGRMYSAAQAKKVGLIDDVKTYDEVIEQIKKDLGDKVEVYEDDTDDLKGFLELFKSEVASLLKSKDNEEKSETEKVIDYIDNDGSGVPMYYAMP